MLSDARSAVSGLVDDDEWLALALLVYAAANMMLGDSERADAAAGRRRHQCEARPSRTDRGRRRK